MSDFNHLHHLNEADRADIIELGERAAAFRSGQEDPERFRHFRLTRGVYGQRQPDVQMFRTKIPFGKLTADQLTVLADLADRYANGKLHLTTRQNVQLHYVQLEDSVKIWEGLAANGMTGREACGNTVRNITGSARAGIDPHEPFDVSPYVQATFEYFLRNPICQDMGRKIKSAFSSSEQDSAFTYIHDFGFIPRVKTVDGQEVRGFKVLIAGGLGAQAIPAHTAHEFLEENLLIPFKEAALRVFDRHGEREKRMKARMKFLVQKLGLPTFLELVENEQKALKYQRYPIDRTLVPTAQPPAQREWPTLELADPEKYAIWLKTNVFEQKQPGFFGVQLKVRLGNLTSAEARQLAVLVKKFAADDVRITMNQGLLLRFVQAGALPHLFVALDELGLGDPGFDSTADITACPGTDTCALGVTSSTGLARQLELVVREEYPHLLEETNLKIKISGCMNSCGQHMAASIGFHGSSLKRGNLVIPAMQVVLGGGVDPDGTGQLAEKIIKLPTRRIPAALRSVLNDYEQHADNQYFNQYFRQRGERYFYDLLKPLADVSDLQEGEVFDWDQSQEYVQAIGVGECAGVAFDVVGAIIGDAQAKLKAAQNYLTKPAFAEAIYSAYTAYIIGAKAALLAKDVRCNTHIGILEDFQKHYVATADFILENGDTDFVEQVLQVNQHEPEADFAKNYVAQTAVFLKKIIRLRESQLAEKLVLENYRA
ncbi:MAG: nitrite/sulfite reductase [Bacteroidetes bacterium]|nr:nitrite/sulfite reductase [Bacteroidota bacterium]